MTFVEVLNAPTGRRCRNGRGGESSNSIMIWWYLAFSYRLASHSAVFVAAELNSQAIIH